MKSESIADLLSFLARLRAAHIYYNLSHHTEGAVMVEVSVPGERWEIEFHEDGEIGVELFKTTGGIRDASALDELFTRFCE